MVGTDGHPRERIAAAQARGDMRMRKAKSPRREASVPGQSPGFEADALALPVEDGSFDVVACQFGAMFFPDKARAFAEARRSGLVERQ